MTQEELLAMAAQNIGRSQTLDEIGEFYKERVDYQNEKIEELQRGCTQDQMDICRAEAGILHRLGLKLIAMRQVLLGDIQHWEKQKREFYDK